ncbi:MAG: DUF3237 family protein [Cyclobacteriaceae bacterium]|nr:DUF3237 family protein [Cyclobacteriaceae bacterium]
MSTKNITVAEHLYDVTAHFTNVIEFGIGLQDLLSDPTKMPPQGARFDFEFEGSVFGSKMKGKIKGTDYVYMRPDGYIRLHIHAVITTDDGVNISLSADGIAAPSDNPSVFNLRENVTLLTTDPAYAWLNQLQIWAQGTSELTTGEIKVSGYSA